MRIVTCRTDFQPIDLEGKYIMKSYLSPLFDRSMGRQGRNLLFSLLLTAAVPGLCATARDIELNDGSHVVGEIVAVEQGTYTVKTERLGTIQLKDADIVAIRAPGAAPLKSKLPADVSPKFAEGMAMIQQKILGNPELLQSVKALAGDPEIQSLLKDPDLMKSILGGNPEGLQNNPKIQKLIANPYVQSIARQLAPEAGQAAGGP
jgi:hypothetical protein